MCTFIYTDMSSPVLGSRVAALLFPNIANKHTSGQQAPIGKGEEKQCNMQTGQKQQWKEATKLDTVAMPN